MMMTGNGDDNDNDDDEFLYLLSIFKVFFPKRGKMGELTSGSEWELLNLDTSSILSMPDDITIQYNTNFVVNSPWGLFRDKY